MGQADSSLRFGMTGGVFTILHSQFLWAVRAVAAVPSSILSVLCGKKICVYLFNLRHQRAIFIWGVCYTPVQWQCISI